VIRAKKLDPKKQGGVGGGRKKKGRRENKRGELASNWQ